jgi:GTPase KRas protein
VSKAVFVSRAICDYLFFPRLAGGIKTLFVVARFVLYYKYYSTPTYSTTRQPICLLHTLRSTLEKRVAVGRRKTTKRVWTHTLSWARRAQHHTHSLSPLLDDTITHTMSRKDTAPLYKLIVLGDGGVGKTALTIQLCLNHFVEEYDPTIEDSYRKQVVLDGQTAMLEILDTAGQEEYTALRDQWIRDGEGFILVYSITSRSSFSRIRTYYEQIQRVKEDDEGFSVVIVGNKSDRNAERVVSTDDGRALARELNSGFFEASAKLNVNIENAFFDCVRACRIQRNGGQVEQPADTGAAQPLVTPGVAAGGAPVNNQTPAPVQKAAQSSTNPPPAQQSAPAQKTAPAAKDKAEPKKKKDKKKKKCVIM